MHENPLVSIIIPIYKVELYIEKCLLSVLNQTYQNIEIILIDDCGQDNSLAIAEQTAKNHANGYKVRILKQDYNQGPSIARNRGIESANGKYIYFLDSDDEITIDCIETLISSCENDEMVIGSFFSEGKEAPPNKRIRYTGNDSLLDAFFQERINLYACNKLLLKKFIISNNLYFPKMLHEDFIWTYQIIAHASSVNLIPNITYKYTLRNDSRTGAMSSKNIYALIKSIDYIEKDISQKGINNHALVYIINTWWSIKSQACKILSYSDFKELQFNKKFSEKKISRNSRIKYYILKSSARIQYIVLRLYYELKKAN